jgi:Protein of unknown function (DUF2796)
MPSRVQWLRNVIARRPWPPWRSKAAPTIYQLDCFASLAMTPYRREAFSRFSAHQGRPAMRIICTACILTAAMAAAAFAEEPRRQLGAHVHGHGLLNIAIEGKKVSMELEVPGADIVGFEHEPSTAEQRAALAEAKAKLANASVLFAPEPKAGCSLERAKVSTEASHEHHDHDAKSGGPGQEKEEEAGHSEFHGEYIFTCASPSRFTAMTFGYFKEFPNAQELDITIVSPKGQSSFEVKRDKPSLDLTGIM